jgi:hypothetical protein
MNEEVQEIYELIVKIDPEMESIITNEDFIKAYIYHQEVDEKVEESDFKWNEIYEPDLERINNMDDEGDTN